ncbi:hypothetical protein NIES4071_16790 [Calothrix sp. NIES-4071]|nr:hypothetical protein NIES4071_16790 [Calothrix sp. NIES-4071]BAZ56012.1 hypothetical protein NIES4105_16740 [Calothrix sp. NIES-4105]
MKRQSKKGADLENTENNFDDIEDVQAPIYTAPEEVRKIIEMVWQLEKNRLDRKSFSHISDDILTIIKSVVQ